MVEHPGSSKYIRTTSSTDMVVARFTELEAFEPDTIYNGVPVELRARLLDIDGTTLETSFKGYAAQTPNVRIWLRQGMEETYLGEMPIDRYGYVALGKVFPRTGPLGSAEIEFSFRGNDFYGPSEDIREVHFKAHTETDIITPNDASLMSGDMIEISGTVKVVRTESVNDVDQDPVIRRDVTVLLNDDDIGTATTDEDGAFTLIYDVKGSGDNLGNAAITARFLGDPVYEPSEDTVDFSILSETNLQVTARVMRKGSTAVIDGTLTSIEGGLHGIVDIQVGDDHYKKMVTGSSGRFATTYDVPWELDVGPIPVTVTYLGNDVYKSSSTTVMFTVEADTMIMVDDQEPLRAHRGNSVAIKGTLVDTWDGAIGPPVPGNLIEMTLPDGTKTQTFTGLNGKFNYYYQLPADLPIGDTQVMLSFTGEHRAPSTATTPIEVVSSTQIEFTEVKDKVHTGEETAIKVQLVDDAGTPLSGQEVKVYLLEDDKEIPMYNGPTDSSGTIAFTTQFNMTGSLSIVARFEGSDHLEPSEKYSYTMAKTAPVVRPPLREQPEVVLGGGLLAIVVMAIMGTESGKYFLFKLLLVPMYTKLKKTDVLDHFVRGQIYGLIRMHPGAHYNLIKKKLDLKNGVLSYHLKTLEREGYILSEIDGIYKRFFPNHVKFEVDFPIFLSKIQERILDFIKAKPGSTQKEMAKELGVSTSTVNDNIKVLRQVKLIEMRRDGKRTRCYVAEG
jgi:predicted transcriptional regulator